MDPRSRRSGIAHHRAAQTADGRDPAPPTMEVASHKLVAASAWQELCCDPLPLLRDLSLKMDQQQIQLERLRNDFLEGQRQHFVHVRSEVHATCGAVSSKINDLAARLKTAGGASLDTVNNVSSVCSDLRKCPKRIHCHGQEPDRAGANIHTPNSDGKSSSGLEEDLVTPDPQTPYNVDAFARGFQPTSPHHMLRTTETFDETASGCGLVQFSNGLIWNCTCALLIVVQAAVTGIEVELNVKQRMDQQLLLGGQEGSRVFSKFNLVDVLEMCFLSWMSVELFVNVYGATKGFKKWVCVSSGMLWNVFDMTIIGLSLLLLTTGYGSALSVLRIVRLSRLGKMMRKLRSFKIIRSIHNVFISLTASLHDLASSFLVISMFIYVVALLMLQGVVIVADEGGLPGPATLPTSDLSYWADGDNDSHMEQLCRLYGSVPRTMLTLFMPLFGGMDWGDAARPVAQLKLYFVTMWVIYVAFIFVGLLNVLVGVFVDCAMKSIQSDRDTMLRDEVEALNATVACIQEIFQASDSDGSGGGSGYKIQGSGCLDRQEFESLLKAPKLVTRLQMLGIDTSQSLTLFRLCDGDHSGTVSYDEFIGGCLRLKGSAKSADIMTLLYQSEKNHRQLSRIVKELKSLRNQMKWMTGGDADAGAND